MGINHGARVRIGIEVFGTQTNSRLRGIGRYCKDLVTALLAGDESNEYVLYGQEGMPTDQIPSASNAVVRLLRPDPSGGEATMAHAMERLAETNPDDLDVLLLLNPLEMIPGYEVPARPMNGLKVAAVVYDLIPLHFQEDHFPLWPGPEFVPRYHRGLKRLRDYDVLLAISEWTRRDILTLLGVAPGRVETIGTASDDRLFVPDRSEPMPEASRALLSRLGIAGPFVFSVGSLEYRKNVWGLIDAFSTLPDALRREHQLVLTYGLCDSGRDQVERYARDRGIADRLVLTGRLADTELRILYQRCAAFVFPSSYEGFGLPILEAMHCGAPVIAGNNSSQVEVVGEAGLLFDVTDADELADHLVRVLEDPDRSREMSKRAVAQARRFRWDETARKTLEALTRLGVPRQSAGPRPCRARPPRKRIAVFSPLPPLRSPIADAAARLLDELKGRYAIDVYHDAGYLPNAGLRSPDFGCYDHRLFERNSAVMGYHALLYQMGASPYHAYMFEKLLRHPGIVALNDVEISGALTPGGIFERSASVVVRSPWCVERVRKWYPTHLGKVSVVPSGSHEAPAPSAEDREAIRARFGLSPEALVVASLGPLRANRINIETIAAFAPLAWSTPEAMLVFVGAEHDSGEARRAVLDLGVKDRVRFLGHDPDHIPDLAAIADIGVYPWRPATIGEASSPLMDLFRLGVPTIVLESASYSDYPQSVALTHRVDADGIAGLARAIRRLAEDRPRREAMGREARQYARRIQTWSAAADAYEEIIDRIAARRERPRVETASTPSRPRIVASPEWLQAAS